MSPRIRSDAVVLVAVGGFLGASLRYLVDTAVASTLLATFLVNVAGSFALGLLLYEMLDVGTDSERRRLFVGTGILSSFTTYSTFVVDTAQSAPVVAVGYVATSYAVGFGAVIASRTVLRRLTGERT